MADLGGEQGGVGGASPVTALVQIVGLVILLGGLYSASLVVSKGWALLEQPSEIVPFADEIEKQTHLNQFVGQFDVMIEFFRKANNAIPAAPPTAASIHDPIDYPKQEPLKPDSTTAVAAPVMPNVSYFVAWMITIVVLGLIARISLWAVTEGGKLILFTNNQDRQLKRVITELATEIRRPQIHG